MGTSTAMPEPDWLAYARRWLGLREQPGTGASRSILAFYADAGHAGVTDDAVPWCAAFVGACLARSGVTPSGSLRARSYLDWGEPLVEGRPGAIVVLSRGASPTLGHVGFLVARETDRVQVLGGNQNDQVSLSWFPQRRVLGYRWPARQVGAASAGDAGFERALAHVLAMEGGYVDDPLDPGGPTKSGITLSTFASDRGIRITSARRPILRAQLEALTSSEIADLYHRRFWLAARCHRMPASIALMHFDCAVNQGPGRAARLLQQAVGADVDGDIGPVTLSAVASADPRETIERYATLRKAAYRALASFSHYGRGWLSRLEKTRQAALALTFDTQTSTKEIKPMLTKPQSQAPKWWGRSITVWGVLITALTAVLPALGPVVGLEVSAEMASAIGRELTNLLQGGGGLLGTAIAIYGRLRAEGPLIRKHLSVRL